MKRVTVVVLITGALMALVVSAPLHWAWAGGETNLVTGLTYVYRETGSAAMSVTINPQMPAHLHQLRLRGADNTETLTVSLDAAAGSAYDFTLVETTFNALGGSCYLFSVNPPLYMEKGDSLLVVWPNTTAATWSIEAFWSSM